MVRLLYLKSECKNLPKDLEICFIRYLHDLSRNQSASSTVVHVGPASIKAPVRPTLREYLKRMFWESRESQY